MNIGGRGARTLMRVPAVRALLIQVMAIPIVAAAVILLPALGGAHLPVAAAVLLQGAFAAALSYWRRLEPWWIVIQFAFAPALLMALALRLPSWIYLAAFLLFLALYWSTYRTRVPYYPSRPAAWQAVAGLLPADRAIAFIDIGSGFGGLAMHLAKLRPESRFAGVELAPLPWLASVVAGRLRCSRAVFARADYADLDLGAYDVVFAYLSPAAMPVLWEQALAEMRPGSLLLSLEFPVPGVAPDFIERPAEGPSIYGYARPQPEWSGAPNLASCDRQSPDFTSFSLLQTPTPRP